MSGPPSLGVCSRDLFVVETKRMGMGVGVGTGTVDPPSTALRCASRESCCRCAATAAAVSR
ncbi:hypothetical protein CGRA01v4_02451 [Colletotrichum graminicola]|nr:hypothetical protein CGRA01v4_02451 [Colletotrichum graminicola]